MPKNTTFVSFLLDETGSMESVHAKTVDGFNSYVETLQKDAADMVFSFVSFNSNETNQRYIAEPLDAVAPLSHAAYCPDAMTPLIDASVKIIKATDDAVTQRGDNPNVVIVILTDGHENCSVEYDAADLAALIKEKTALGWQFVFLGADLDAFSAARAADFNIDARHTVSYRKHRSADVFASSAVNLAKYSYSGDPDALAYSQAQRRRVEDTHTEKHLGSAVKPRPGVAPTNRPTRTRTRQPSAVGDIDLRVKV